VFSEAVGVVYQAAVRVKATLLNVLIFKVLLHNVRVMQGSAAKRASLFDGTSDRLHLYNIPMTSKEILGIRVDFGLTMDDVLGIVENKLLKDGDCHYICTTNPEFIMDAQLDPVFKRIINESDLSVPDGAGVIYANKYLEKIKSLKKGKLFPVKAFVCGTYMGLSSLFVKKGVPAEKITGVELTYKLCELASKKGYTVFFLGGKPKDALGRHVIQDDKDLATMAGESMKKLYPGLSVVGGTSKFVSEIKDDKKTVEYIKKCMHEKGVDHIDFLFVAYGHSKQERWVSRNIHKIPAKVSIGLGGTFDYISGQIKLPPEIYVKRNLGWVYRLIIQPWRAKRIFKAFPLFPLKVFRNSIQS